MAAMRRNAAKAKPALPNLYLDMRTIYADAGPPALTAANAALCDQRISRSCGLRIPHSRAAQQLADFGLAGNRNWLPAFSRRRTSSTLAAPFWISADI